MTRLTPSAAREFVQRSPCIALPTFHLGGVPIKLIRCSLPRPNLVLHPARPKSCFQPRIDQPSRLQLKLQVPRFCISYVCQRLPPPLLSKSNSNLATAKSHEFRTLSSISENMFRSRALFDHKHQSTHRVLIAPHRHSIRESCTLQ